MKKMGFLLKKCKTLSRQLSRSTSYTSLRSKSCRDEHLWGCHHDDNKSTEQFEIVYVGSTRRRYSISSKHLDHPLLNALITPEKKPSPSALSSLSGGVLGGRRVREITVNCEVVLFDHLLWMLENADPDDLLVDSESCLEELAELYAY